MLAPTSSGHAAAARSRAVSSRAPQPRRLIAPVVPSSAPPRRRAPLVARQADDASGSAPNVETAKEAIDAGLALFQQQRYADALALFERAPTLPGTGLKRYRDRPPLASDGERQAALFNAACAHAALGAVDQGLAALAGCLGAGYEDFAQVDSDPDLAPLRADPRFAQLMARYRPRNNGGGGLLGALFGKK